nr:transposase [Arthrobacter sp. 9AX]
MHEISDRRDRLDRAITSIAYASEYTPVVRSLQCLRGISTLTAFGLAVEIGEWDRFTGSTIGAYLGLVPTEHSSGVSRSQGSITKNANHRATASLRLTKGSQSQDAPRDWLRHALDNGIYISAVLPKQVG